MKIRPIASLAGLAVLVLSSAAAQAALPEGAKAPGFTTQASLAGKPYRFALADALRKGPVVLYFYPAAFTQGCTIEAHMFAEATADFEAAGATVIGISADPIETLNRFSREACRDKFAVASATPAIIKAYDVALADRPDRSDRTSYVIAPNGRVLLSYSDRRPHDHVKNTLAAVRNWQATRKRK